MNKSLHVLFALVGGATLVLLLGLAITPVHDFDLFWQLQTGKYMWQNQTFLYHDTFTLAAEVPRWEHCWLHDLIVFAVFQLGGYAGISILKGLLVAATAVVLAVAARARGASWESLLLWLPALCLIPFWAWRERPQLWSYLAFALVVWLIQRDKKNPGQGIWWLLPLTVVWTNLHAGVILVFPLALAWVVGTGIDRRLDRFEPSPLPADRRRTWLVAGLIPAASLCTPYGFDVLKALAYSPFLGEASGALTQIANIDWLPTTYSGYPLYFYTLGVALVLTALAWRRLTTTEMLLLFGLGFMGLRLERHTPFFFYACAVVLPLATDAFLPPLVRCWQGWRQHVVRLLLLGVAMAAVVYFARLPWREGGIFTPGLRTWHFPVAEADFIKTENLPKNLFNSYAAGGYLAWRLFPEYLVFWDPRQDSAMMFESGLKVMSASREWPQILTRFEVNTIVTEACSQVDGARYPLVEALRVAPDWALVFAGETHLVFVRRAAVAPQWLRQRELPAARIDDTILGATWHLSQQSPIRVQAYWEAARVYLTRGDARQARALLELYFNLTRPEQRHPAAAETYRQLQGY